MPTIGVLAIQGDFEAHAAALERAGAERVEVRTRGDLAGLDGLVTRRESTTMTRASIASGWRSRSASSCVLVRRPWVPVRA